MKKLIFTLITILLIGLTPYAQDVHTIIKRCDSVTYAPVDQVNEITMTLTDSKGREQERKAVATQMGTDYRLFRFTSPASQEGIAFLSLPDEVMYVYLPAYEKARRIASHVKNQSFAGTDLSYEDMESVPLAKKYDVKLIETTDDHFLVEMVPKPDKKSDYSKMMTRIDRDNYTILSSDYYDRGGNVVKRMQNNKVELIGGYWIITDMLMEDLKKKHSTRLLFTGTKVDTGLTEDDFSVRILER